MKSCRQCGTDAADDAVTCTNCGRRFASAGGGEGQARDAAVWRRPTGAGFLLCGWIALAVGAAAAVFGWMTPTPADTIYAGLERISVPAVPNWTLILGGGGLLNLGLILLCTGSIIRAMWFLNGDAEREEPTHNG